MGSEVTASTAGADLALEALELLVAPSRAWWECARRQSLHPGWSRSEGRDALEVAHRRCIIEYEGDFLCETDASARDAAHGHEHFKRLYGHAGTPLATEHAAWCVDAADVRREARRLLASREAGALAKLAHLGLGALSDGARASTSALAPVRDGLRIFLVPLRDVPCGAALTHHYNPDPLVRR